MSATIQEVVLSTADPQNQFPIYNRSNLAKLPAGSAERLSGLDANGDGRVSIEDTNQKYGYAATDAQSVKAFSRDVAAAIYFQDGRVDPNQKLPTAKFLVLSDHLEKLVKGVRAQESLARLSALVSAKKAGLDTSYWRGGADRVIFDQANWDALGGEKGIRALIGELHSLSQAQAGVFAYLETQKNAGNGSTFAIQEETTSSGDFDRGTGRFQFREKQLEGVDVPLAPAYRRFLSGFNKRAVDLVNARAFVLSNNKGKQELKRIENKIIVGIDTNSGAEVVSSPNAKEVILEE